MFDKRESVAELHPEWVCNNNIEQTILKHNKGLTEQSLKRALRSQISFQWLHEDVLAENLTLDKKYERVNVIKDLQEVMKEVRKFEKIMNELIVKIDQAEVSSLKRLQWSVGTNPRLKSVHQSVVQGREERKIFLAENIETAKRVEKLYPS